MSGNDTFEDGALWDSILELQTEMESTFRTAARSRELSSLGAMVAPLRKLHWYAAFMGAVNLADLAAAGAAFVAQLQQERYGWSVELGGAVKSLLKRTRAFCNARPDEPAAGVFIDSDEAVLQGPELKRPVPVDDLLSLFRRRQIDISAVSACRQLSFSTDPVFSHAITVPKSARARHQADRNLTLVYLDLDVQEIDAPDMMKICEAAAGSEEILLHGPLAIPWKNYKSYKGKRPYYLLLDTTPDTREWLKGREISGRIVRELKKAEKPPEPVVQAAVPAGAAVPVPAVTETKVIIREVAAAPAAAPVFPDMRGDGGLEELKREDKEARKLLRRRGDENIKIRVGTKLILIVSIILIISLGVTTGVGVLIFRDNLETRLEMNANSMSSIVAKQAENELLQISSSANLLFQVGAASGGGELVDDFFANDPNLIFVGIPDSPYQYINRTWFRNNRIFDEQQIVALILDARRDDLEKARGGETVIINCSPLIPNLESPVLAMAVPFQLGTERQSLVILTDVGDTLVESVRLQQGDFSTSIVNPDGEVLADRNLNRIFDGANISGTAAYEKMYTEGLRFGIIDFSEVIDGTPVQYFGYYKLIDNLNLGVVTTVLRSDAYGDIRTMILLNLYFSLAIILVSIVAVMFFARTITVPIQRLYIATRKIKAKAWDTASVVPKYKDEIGSLSSNFNAMIPDLRATANLMERTSVFVNEDVADMIYNETLPDHAETRDVTVFFSDVRGFTSMSEAMGDPQILLDNLSAYFDAMVPCVRQTEGTIDKFIGDALMAVWGSMGRELPNHAESAIEAALKMRESLIEFNSDRDAGDPFRPPFQIGCGLHSGPATVGLMGSSSKQEWAHMGKTVNIASRVEGVNAAEGTDILISPETASRVEGIYHLQQTSCRYELKGIAEPIFLYAVLGRMDDPSRPMNLEDLRVRLGRPAKLEPKKGGSGGKIKAVTG